MANLEVVVRPVVFPNIRPAPARSLPLVDDPEKGFCVIKGNGAKQVNLNYSFTWTFSKSKNVETQRRVDVARVSQMDDQGNVNKDNYVDIEVANKIWSEGGKKPFVGFNGDDLVPTVPGRGWTGDDIKKPEKIEQHYKPVEEAKNIKVLKKNIIKKNNPIPGTPGIGP